ncbi:MAG: type V CRISPR-associated protein Cpf1 [Candidatus Magasanikbacteria bacterium CG_4_10_14_0_8_um_filter_32_14]|uniref:Type V CRISPR-associated protein Cpf1 n=2 Tax=Candidatus Magasanikiibacteriota TaxID=1752731 RepID=A0A2M7R8M4_9BACT|nr:MAG: type V CRISPR-associated protein Cpf1 [Candidatus Magasanikbacteria bacterium CG1_02_32_51]PIY93100.1 MAG: type V CRISPR-associated protein Cpf1 [Candidatus Magasanikbacteria bacterium CG_4_10_14_0_8_um_filter_32_14]
MSKNNVWDKFTNQYSLSKTLRFELKPVGKTREKMNEQLKYDKQLQTFLKDQEIEDAYQYLKPFFDKLHKEFITDSLDSDTTKKIDFSDYLIDYRDKKDLTKKEDSLRKNIGEVFVKAGDRWKKEKYPKYEWKKGSNVANGSGILLTQDVLMLIKDLNPNDQKIKKMIEETFKGFFTYFSGFNLNRENYYTTKVEKATAVATRIVHDNLPKFCDNLVQFECIIKKKKNGEVDRIERKSEYLNAYQYLKSKGRTTQIKDAESGKMIEAEVINENMFSISYFSACLSQSGIEEYNRTIGHYNLLINLYNQAKEGEEKDLKKSEKKFKRLPIFKTLYKQIGCGEKEPLFFSLTHDTKLQVQENKENYKKPYSVEQILEQAKLAGDKYFKGKSNDGILNTIPEFSDYILQKESYGGVYWSKVAINTISNRYFENWHTLKDALIDAKVFEKGKKGDEEDVKIPESIELQGFFDVLDTQEGWKSEGIFFKKSLTEELKNKEADTKNKKRREIVKEAKRPSQALLALLFDDIQEHANLFLNQSDEILKLEKYSEKESKEKIKQWMDSALAVNRILKYFFVKESKAKGEQIDPIISEALKVLFNSEDATWFKWYDALRNYLTKKPQDDVKENKLKLNFENSTLAGGWDINKESDNYCVILQDQKGKQHLGIIAKKEKQRGYNKIFERTPENPLYKIDSGEVWQKMEYKQIAVPTGIGGFVRKCFNTAQQYGWKCPDNCLNSEGKIIIKNDEAKENLEAIIDCYKDFFTKYEKDGFKYKNFNFNFKESEEYEELNSFFSDVERQGYKLGFITVNKTIIDKWVEDGTIYLFEIKNQDTNDGKKDGHKNNLHTIYWKALFEDVGNKPKLNGGAELFYRKALLKDKQEKIEDNYGKEIIKNFRFSKEKFLFHCPIKLNYKAKSYSHPKYALPEINKQTNEFFITISDICFLGIDRGEKHLAYYSLVNQKEEIIDQGTLNMPFVDKDGKPRSIKKEKFRFDAKVDKWVSEEMDCWNYNDLLDAMASNRDMARKNWQTIGTIKELKNGYISQVVRKIVDLAIDKNRGIPSFIVLENLNAGFMRGRQKIEKSVYQKLELALAKKLNFVVDKTVQNGEIGSVTNALQLTPPVTNFQNIENRKQVGIMLYTRADYTSQTDPVTGWRKSIYLKKGSEEYIKSQIMDSFDDFGFDGKNYYFKYTVDLIDPIKKTSEKKFKKQWTLYSGINGKSLDRFRGERSSDKNVWIKTLQDIKTTLDAVFIGFDLQHSLRSQIINDGIMPKKIENSQFTGWESLRFAIEMIQQIRNIGVEKGDEDFILSPVRDKNENHFDSRKAKENEPNSGDANGAYNIARKGIIMNEHIKKDLIPFIQDKEWDAWLAGREVWDKWLIENKDSLIYKK